MAKKVLSKKLILTADFTGLTLEEKLSKQTDMVKAQIANPTLVPGLNPTAANVQGQIVAVTDPNTGLIHQRSILLAQAHALTVQINKAEVTIKDIIVSQWMPQAQTALTGTPNAQSNAALLLFGIKGQTGGSTTGTGVMEKTIASAPVIVKIDNLHNQQTLHIHNNITGKIGHPKNVLRIDVYGQTGGTLPADLAALIANGGGWLGTAKHGKFVSPLTTANAGKTEFYIAVYIDKVTLKPIAYSTVASEAII